MLVSVINRRRFFLPRPLFATFNNMFTNLIIIFFKKIISRLYSNLSSLCVKQVIFPQIKEEKIGFCLTNRAQRNSIRSQTINSKVKENDITKYQTFLTKFKIVCIFERIFVNSRGRAYHTL